MQRSCFLQCPVGILEIEERDGAVTALRLAGTGSAIDGCRAAGQGGPDGAVLSEACRQLDEYFRGVRTRFDLPLSYEGTVFQRKVWDALRKIPYGETRSYAEIAAAVGSSKAVRAVGQANGRNPLMILVPCHRVVQKDGGIGGFSCGVEVKRYLLDLERRFAGAVSGIGRL